MQAEGGLKTRAAQIEPARNVQRTPQFGDRLLGRKLRPLVEPFRRHQLGAGAHRRAPAFDLDLHPHKGLHCGRDVTAPKRNGLAKVTGRSNSEISRTAKRGGMIVPLP